MVITGAGKAFCTGGDVDEFASGEVQAISKAVSSERHAMCKAVLAINTHGKAGHRCGERHCCRRRLQPGAGLRHEDSQRQGPVQPDLHQKGVHPDWGGIYFLPRLVGYAKACELIFTAEIIDASRGIAHRARQQGGAAR
ncbi:MAG: hypothetical protein MZV70_39125 [Desulfobacterales bacterium]|nr:hypothetical protein [Desulfobacterales bacterium]